MTKFYFFFLKKSAKITTFANKIAHNEKTNKRPDNKQQYATKQQLPSIKIDHRKTFAGNVARTICSSFG